MPYSRRIVEIDVPGDDNVANATMRWLLSQSNAGSEEGFILLSKGRAIKDRGVVVVVASGGNEQVTVLVRSVGNIN